jgi:hypothetical protein
MSDDHGSVIHYEAGQHVARITFNRPGKLNALNSALVGGLQAALSRAAADDLVKVVVLKGAGRGFSAGYDLSEEAEDQTWDANSWPRATGAPAGRGGDLPGSSLRQSLPSTTGRNPGGTPARLASPVHRAQDHRCAPPACSTRRDGTPTHVSSGVSPWG